MDSNRINESDDKYVMYIFINTDLDMEKGKISSQVGHAVQLITEEIVRASYESRQIPQFCYDFRKWKGSCPIGTKIVKKATQIELLELLKMENSRPVIDTNATTQVRPDSLTCVGFFPSCKLNKLFEKFKLL